MSTKKKFISDYPNLLSEWDFKKNSVIQPNQVTHGSKKKIWWKCKIGHNWQQRPQDRTRAGEEQGCPYCAGQKPSKENNASLNKDVNILWHPDNLPKTPKDFSLNSGIKVKWKCPKGEDHVWTSRVADVVRGNGCPYCSGRNATKDDNLLVKQPNISKEWDYEKNYPYKPEDFKEFSNAKVHWICSFEKEHKWEAQINSRSGGRGCPKCNSQTSFDELRIYTEMMYLFNEVENRKKIDKVEADIFIEEIKFVIEFDGWYWHKDKLDNDLKKNDFFKKNGIKYIRVRERDLFKIEESDIQTNERVISKNTINKIVKSIFLKTNLPEDKRVLNYLNSKDFMNNDVYKTYLSYLPDPHPEKSLEGLFPELCKEWDYEKNFPLTPKNVTKGSDKGVWWKCVKGHSWKTKIFNRTGKQKTGCPYCNKWTKTRFENKLKSS